MFSLLKINYSILSLKILKVINSFKLTFDYYKLTHVCSYKIEKFVMIIVSLLNYIDFVKIFVNIHQQIKVLKLISLKHDSMKILDFSE